MKICKQIQCWIFKIVFPSIPSKFHILYFNHIHTIPSSSVSSPPYIPNSGFSSFFSFFLYVSKLRWGQYLLPNNSWEYGRHLMLVTLKKADFLSARSIQSPSQRCDHVPFPSPLCLAYIYSCPVHLVMLSRSSSVSFSVVSKNHSFLEVIFYLWLLKFSHFLFCGTPRSSGRRVSYVWYT